MAVLGKWASAPSISVLELRLPSGSVYQESPLLTHENQQQQGNVPAIKLALGITILTHRTSFLANNFHQYRYSALFIRMTGKSTVSELVCQQVVLSASWFVRELSCQRVDCQRVDCQRVVLSAS